MLATDTAVNAINPDPVNIILSGLDSLIDGRGQTHELDLRDVLVVMQKSGTEQEPDKGKPDPSEVRRDGAVLALEEPGLSR